VDKLVTPRRDSVRKIPRDSVRWRFARDSIVFRSDSIRWFVPRDSVRWVVADARFDTARTSWVPRDSVRFETGKSIAPALYSQNGNSPFAQHLFPPELVMQNQSRIRLTEQQRNLIVQEINRLQATAVNVQWRVADESGRLAELLSQDSVAETAAIEQMDKMIGFETAVKRAQLSMLIRIRNVLTPEQRVVLQNLQKQGK
jgi:Spy/CpxP family protein refolding chaperone